MVCYMFVCLTFFFFFKQKTAYDMRISDWSSDVCSSDLVCVQRSAEAISARRKPPESSLGCLPDCRLPGSRRRIDRVSPGIVDRAPGAARRPAALPGASGQGLRDRHPARRHPGGVRGVLAAAAGRGDRDVPCAEARSEENTSEIQSLMRNS